MKMVTLLSGPPVLLSTNSIRHCPETPEHGLYCPLLLGVYPEDHGIRPCGEY